MEIADIPISLFISMWIVRKIREARMHVRGAEVDFCERNAF